MADGGPKSHTAFSRKPNNDPQSLKSAYVGMQTQAQRSDMRLFTQNVQSLQGPVAGLFLLRTT